MKYLFEIFFLLIGILPAFSTAFADAAAPAIKIGASLALTGKLAFIGESERDGLILAADQINQAGGISGRKIELIIEDNFGQAKAAVNSVHKLLQIDKPLIIFSAFTHVTQAIKDLVAQSEALLFYASSLKSIARSSPYIFRDYFDIEADGRNLAQAVQQAGFSKVATIRDEGDVCLELESSFRTEASKRKIAILKSYEYTSGETDLKPLLLKATTPRPEALVLCTWRETQIVMTQLSQLGRLDVPTFHTVGPFLPVSDTPEIRKLYQQNRAVSSWYGFPEKTDSARQQEFVEKFQARFKRQPRPDAAYAYDDLFALAAALEPCVKQDKLNRNCLANHLKDVKLEGVSGELSFDSDGNSTRQGLLISVRDGRWQKW